MAGADGIRNLELEPLEVPENLHKRGNKFIKWPKSDSDDTISATPVTLRIDPKGYIIYWQEPNKDTESLEVSCIRDTRIGKYAKIPKSEKWEKALQSMVPQILEVAGDTTIPIESKCLTIVYGMKFHEPNFLNFIAVEENPLDIITQWADFLLKLACHPLTWHISVEKSIEKMHAKLKYETNQFGKIPVKKCIKMFGGNPKRAESALHSVGLTTKGKKDETIDSKEFPLIAFKKVLQLTCQRPELDKVFSQLGARRMYLSLEQMKKFVNTDQRDPRLNEILHPFLTDEQVMDLITKYEPNVMLSNRAQLSLEGLDAYLQSDENLPVSTAQYGLYQDMSQPLSHYFINSSHNTYLTGNQYRSRSNAEIYRQCLLAGCRCVELDCWESTTGDEPVITHGFTLCSEVPFKEVIEAINESAFKTSQYPVILSFENHVDNPAQQAKMAEYCRDIFGDKLLIDPLEGFELAPGKPLPSPRHFLRKIIVKNKKQRSTDTIKKPAQEEKGPGPAILQTSASLDVEDLRTSDDKPLLEESEQGKTTSGTLPRASNHQQKRKQSAPTPTTEKVFDQNGNALTDKAEEEKEGEKDDTIEEEAENGETKDKIDEEDEDDDEDEDGGRLLKDEFDENMKESGTATKESKAYEAMSSLVNYIEPIRFKSFDISDRRDRSYEISSFTENAALRLITYYPIEIVNYNKRQLSRIYPRGARVDSSNYNPQLFWNAGCQLVALNFQTLGPNMQLNLGLFEFNDNCGYLLKPEHMRRKDRQFDPFAHNTMDGVVAGSLAIKIISGQFLSSSKVSTFVEVDMYGLVADTVKKKYKTSTVYNNGTNPHYDSDTFLFNKVVLPAIATVRIGVMDTNGNCLGQRFLPVEGLRPGYRYITLRNEGNQPLTMPSLFVHIEVKDYIPEKLIIFASMLANPIEHVKKQEKEEKEINERREALRRLLDVDEMSKIGVNNIEKAPNGEVGGNKPKIVKGPPPPDTETDGPQTESHVYVMPGPDDEPAPNTVKPTPEKPKKPGLDQQLQSFEPATIEAIKGTRKFSDLQKKMDKKVTKYLKEQREAYDTVYSFYFEKPRRPSFVPPFTSKKKKIKGFNLPFELNPALPGEAKKEHMMLLLKQHLGEEKDKKQRLNDDFIKSFDDLLRLTHEAELAKLKSLSKGEADNVRARKEAEKDERMRKVSKDYGKEELELKKKEIVESHIQDCVQELRMLESLQEKRLEKVKKEQQEILMMMTDVERTRVDEITQEYNDHMRNIEQIYDIRQAEYYRSHGNTNINSVTYPSGANDKEYNTLL